MNTKLTLNLDVKTIKNAKKLAIKNRTSLSKMVEAYFTFITKDDDKNREISPVVQEISGIIKLPKKYQDKKEYRNHIVEKYLTKK